MLGLPKIDTIGYVCGACVYDKQTKKYFPIGKAWRASSCFELVHANLCDSMNTTYFGSSKYFLLFIDDCSRMRWVYFMQFKLETFAIFKKFKAFIEKQSDLFIKMFRTNRGGELFLMSLNHFVMSFLFIEI